MKKVAVFAGRTRKAIGTGIAGVYAWAGLVIASAPTSITAEEWYVLGGVAVSVAAVYGLTNDAPAEAPQALPVGDPAQQHP